MSCASRAGRVQIRPARARACTRGRHRLRCIMSAQPVGLIVLAAGASSRMGTPKQLLRYDGETLLRRAVRVALGARCRPAVVVLGAQAEALRGEVVGAQVVINEEWAEGMASSLRCGLRALEAATSEPLAAAVLLL